MGRSTDKDSLARRLPEFGILQSTFDHLPTSVHKAIARQLIDDGTWVLIPDEEVTP